MLILSLAPSVTYIDHWVEFTQAATTGHAAAESEAEVEHHEAHCHAGAASCSDQPVPTNLRTMAQIVQFDEPAMQTMAIAEHAASLAEFIGPVLVEPPRG